MKIIVNKYAEKKFRDHYPLIQEEDLETTATTSDWLDFFDRKGNYIATGYLGKQNKGIGWLVSWHQQNIDNDFFAALFAKAKQKRQSYYHDEGTTAFRLFNGEGDGFGGITVDLYNDYAVFSWYNETLYQHRELITAAFQGVYPEVKGAYEKIRFESKGLPESQLLFGEKAPEPLVVKENFVNYATYLNEGLMTGIFLDQKEVRGRLAEGLASGKSLLNMFSYTGAFSVAAAMGGAQQTTSVDLAKRSLEKTREQFKVNGIDPETQKIHVMDVFGYFNYARKKELRFDVIVLDPPSFARNKKKVFSVAKNYGELITDSVAILEDGGEIIASTNAANLSSKKFRTIIEAAFKESQVNFQLLEEYHLPADYATTTKFPEGDYLKVYIYKVKK